MHIIECKNCGKQVEIKGGNPDERCYWCHKSALKKEATMEKQAGAKNVA